MQPTILIVDDEKHTRDGLRRLLEDEYDVYVADDIGGAMNVLEREHGRPAPDRSAAGGGRWNGIDRACTENAASAHLRHDDGLRFGRYRGRGDETRGLRFRDQAAQSRQSRNADCARAAIAPDGAGESHLTPANRRTFGLENILGESLALREVLDTIRQVAPSSANVLIEGESGTGKELAAHAIHN